MRLMKTLFLWCELPNSTAVSFQIITKPTRSVTIEIKQVLPSIWMINVFKNFILWDCNPRLTGGITFIVPFGLSTVLAQILPALELVYHLPTI